MLANWGGENVLQVKGKYSWIKHIDFMTIDLTALFLAFLVSYWIAFGDFSFVKKNEWKMYLFVVLELGIIIDFFTTPYSGTFRRSCYTESIVAFQLTFYNFLFASMVFYVLKVGALYSRKMSFNMYCLYFVFSLLFKLIWKELLISGKLVVKTTDKLPIFLISNRENIEQTIANVTEGDFQHYNIKGVHLIDGTLESIKLEELSIPLIGEDYEKYILENNIKEVLITVSPDLVDKGMLERLNANAVGLNMVIEAAIGFQPEDQYIQNFGVYKTVSISIFSFTPRQIFYLGIKRMIDIFASLIGLVVLIPITLIVKCLNLLSGDTAKIFYQQERVGQYGKPIKIWKFRSMVPNADEILGEMLKEDRWRSEWEEKQKFDNDPRVTKVGQLLRKTSIDELPQILNVLKGNMSLVGPRPLVIGELEKHGGLKLYEKVKPGITGWWACNGRSNIDYRERLELEYYYVKNCNLYLDILCIFRTILAVIKKDGAQ